MKQLEQRLAKLETGQSIINAAQANRVAALGRCFARGYLVDDGVRFIAGDNAPDTMPPLAELLNLARERARRDHATKTTD
jgi:hypothetical protein